MSQDLTDDWPILEQGMAWCRQTKSNNLSQCWPRSTSPYGVSRPNELIHYVINPCHSDCIVRICWHYLHFLNREIVLVYSCNILLHDDVIKWKHFPRYWPLCGEFTGPGEFPAQWPVTRSFDVFFDLRLNKRLSKQPWGWWFQTPSWSLWHQCNVHGSQWPVVSTQYVRWLLITRRHKKPAYYKLWCWLILPKYLDFNTRKVN